MKAKEIRFTDTLENPEKYVEEAVEFIRQNVGDDEKVVCALSGGVDSSVVAKLFHRAIGDRLHSIHFDTGFMRVIHGREEPEIVKEMFKDVKNFELVDAKDIFYGKIFGVENAEEKRKAFRHTYEKVLNEKIRELGASVITQGTIRPDIEETEARIKSQNNVDTAFEVEKLVEPIAGLIKPQVRRVAKELGFSREVYMRQPFLGPGLSARTVGSINMEKLECERVSNDRVERFVENYFEDKYGKEALWDRVSGSRIPFQYFAGTFDPELQENTRVMDYLKDLGLKDVMAYTLKNKATGVCLYDGGRGRVYAPPLLLKGELDPEMIHYFGKEIPDNFDVSRVLYCLSEGKGQWLVSVRAVRSKDARDAWPLQIPLGELRSLGEKIVNETDAGAVAYDVTPKPPATIEYE